MLAPKVRVPRQKRSRQNFEAMVRVAQQMFVSKGVQDTSVREIASEAGSSIGAFYQRFENKDAIIYTVFCQVQEEILLQLEQLQTSVNQPLVETLQKIVATTFASVRTHRLVLLAMLMEIERNPVIRDYITQLRIRSAEFYAEVLMRHQSEIAQSNIDLASAMVNRIIYSSITQLILYEGHPETEEMLNADTTEQELVKMLHAYLTGI